MAPPLRRSFALECCIPSLEQAGVLYETFHEEVRNFESRLLKARHARAKQARIDEPNLIYQDCARDQPPPVDTLIQSVEFPVDSVSHDDCSIVLQTPVQIDASAPIVVNGKPRQVIYAEMDQIWIDDVADIAPGNIGRQQHTFTSDRDIMNQFGQVWKPRWQKLHQVQPGQWQQIMDFCTATFRPIQWHFESITPVEFVKAVGVKKKRSAIGPDGVSRNDLLSLPEQAHQELCSLFAEVESGGMWPVQLVQGFVNCLSKGKGDSHVDGFRPIVVYPLIVRTWSSLRARSAFHDLKGHLPSSVRGGVPQCQAKMIWYHISQLVEFAHLESCSLQGLAVDIRRAFNALPREPLWHLLQCLHFPEPILHAWKAFVTQQQRRFRVRTSISAPHWSCTGFPEGCAMSVFAMALTDLLLDAWLAAMVPTIHSLHTYVDDWHVLANTPEDLNEVWKWLGAFASHLELEVDATKSFMWAAHDADRKQLQGGPVPVLLSSKALGAHHNFCRRRGNKGLTDRIGALSMLWPRLRNSFSPLKIKARVLFQLAWPRAFYGISVVHLGQSHYMQLRTGALRGLRSNRIGASPALHLCTFNLWCDPEAWCIMQTFREAREVGNIQLLQLLLQLIGSGSPSVPRNGPASILCARASRLCWTLTPSGMFSDAFGTFDLFGLPWDALVARIKWAWPFVLGADHSHRRSFAGLHLTWLDEVPRSLSRYSPQDQIYLRCAMDGTLYQDVAKEKSDRGHASLCQFCQAQDSFFHRLWCCPVFDDCRTHFKWPEVLSELPLSFTCHGWPLLPSAWSTLQQYFNSLGTHDFPAQFPVVLDGIVQDLFVDGTCAWPSEPCLRYSAWCVTRAVPGQSLDHQVVVAGHTSGQHQSAFRAELEAMANALDLVVKGQFRARIWSDCLGVIRGTRRIFRNLPIKPNKSHADLWFRIEDSARNLAEGQVVLVKVVSHAACHAARNGVEEWAFWQNRLVDEAAARVNQRRPTVFWECWQRTHDSLVSGRHLHAAVQEVILKVARKSQTLRKAEGLEHSAIESNTREASVEVSAPLHPSCQRRQWQFSSRLAKRYRWKNINAVHQWWQRHGVPALQSRAPLRWISGLQLFLDFYCSSGFLGCLSPKHGVWYDDPGENPRFVPGIGKRSTMFIRIWTAYCKENQVVINHCVTKPDAISLAYWTMCWRLPWAASRIDAIDDIILQQVGRQLDRPGQVNGVFFDPVCNDTLQ